MSAFNSDPAASSARANTFQARLQPPLTWKHATHTGRNCLSLTFICFCIFIIMRCTHTPTHTRAPTDARAPGLFIDTHRGITAGEITLFSSFLTPVALLRLLMVFSGEEGRLAGSLRHFFSDGHVECEKDFHINLTPGPELFISQPHNH